jgi:hypothetical protein
MKFFELADVEGAARKKSRSEKISVVYPIALEGVQKLVALFVIKREIDGKPGGAPCSKPASQRLANGTPS